jgi:transposase
MRSPSGSVGRRPSGDQRHRPWAESGGRRLDAPDFDGPRKTLYNRFVRWAAKGVWALDPIARAIRTHVLSAQRIHSDDTTAPVLAKLKTVTGRLWTLVRDDRPFGGEDPPAAFFEYTRARAGEYPQRHLADYVGIMPADAFAGYNAFYDARRRPGPVIEAACWSHWRRQFFDLAKLTTAPIATEAVRRIDELFEIERTINGKTAAEPPRRPS